MARRKQNPMNAGTLLLLAGAAYLVWQSMQTPAAAAATTPTTIPPVNPVTPPQSPSPSPAPGSGVVPPTPTGVTAAQVYASLVAALAASVPAYVGNPTTFTATPYQFLYYVNQNPAVPSYNSLVAAGLNFQTMFGNDTAPITLATFWSKMAPWFQTTLGMSGLAWMPRFNPMLVPRFMSRSWGKGY